jgi:hypothetical protein
MVSFWINLKTKVQYFLMPFCGIDTWTKLVSLGTRPERTSDFLPISALYLGTDEDPKKYGI